MWTIRKWYMFFLQTPISTLVSAVDKYNSGEFLPKEAREALEIIEGLDLDD